MSIIASVAVWIQIGFAAASIGIADHLLDDIDRRNREDRYGGNYQELYQTNYTYWRTENEKRSARADAKVSFLK